MSLIKLCKKLLFSLLLFFANVHAFAASCCGGSSSLPSLITGDDAAQISASYAYSWIVDDVYADGFWHKRHDEDVSQVVRLNGAHIFADRWQTGFSLPVQTHSRNGVDGGSATGLGDIAAQLGYEYLPDWDYNPWRPKGIAFLTLTLPTGRSIYESVNTSGIDSRGRGFWAVGIGTILSKTWSLLDANLTIEVHRSFNKAVNNAELVGVVQPGYGGTFSPGIGLNFWDFRLGGAISWSYEDAVNVTGNNASQGSLQRFATGTLSLSYLFADDWSCTLNYADQALFGNPLNTSLGKSYVLLLQRRWQR